MNSMSGLIRTASAAAVLSAVAFGLASTASADTLASTQQKFHTLDANGDGYLTKGELKRYRGYEKAFDQADENRDGRLDLVEFIKSESIYQRTEAAEFIDDSVITAKVKAALLAKPQLSAFDVAVATYRGHVQLAGFVDDPRQRAEAARVASSVDGVIKVTNNLAVK